MDTNPNTDQILWSAVNFELRARGYKTFFKLNSDEHEISIAHKSWKNKDFSCLILSDVVIIWLINAKMPTIVVGILTFVSRINVMHAVKTGQSIGWAHRPYCWVCNTMALLLFY